MSWDLLYPGRTAGGGYETKVIHGGFGGRGTWDEEAIAMAYGRGDDKSRGVLGQLDRQGFVLAFPQDDLSRDYGGELIGDGRCWM